MEDDSDHGSIHKFKLEFYVISKNLVVVMSHFTVRFLSFCILQTDEWREILSRGAPQIQDL